MNAPASRNQQPSKFLALPLRGAAFLVAGAGAVAGGVTPILFSAPFNYFDGQYVAAVVGVPLYGVVFGSIVGALSGVGFWLLLARLGQTRGSLGMTIRLRVIAPAFAPVFLLAAFVPAYLWLGRPLVYFRFIYVLCLAAVPLLTLLLTQGASLLRGGKFTPALAACLVATGLHAVFYSILSILMHRAMNLGFTDCGIWAEALSNTLRGRFLHSNFFPFGSVLGDHMVPIILAFLPFFALFPRMETLHVIHSIALSLGALPVFMLARQRWRKPWPAFLASLCYLFFPSTSHLVYSFGYGFHPVILSIPLLLAAMYFLLAGKLIRFWVFIALALLCNETVAVAVAGLSFFTLVRLRRPILACSLFVVGLAWFFFCVEIAIPHFAQGSPYWQVDTLYSHVGGSPAGIVKYVIAHPVETLRLAFAQRKLSFLLQLLTPLGLLPLLSPSVIASAAPTGLLLLLADRTYMQSIAFWNQSTLIPFIFLGAIDAVGKLSGIPIRSKGVTSPTSSGEVRIAAFSASLLTASLLSCYLFGFAPFSRNFNPDRVKVRAHDRIVKDLRDIIPRNAGLSATDRVAAHFIDQADLFTFRGEPRQADYVLLDLDDSWGGTSPILEWRDELLRDDGYGLTYFRDGFLLFAKGADPSPEYLALVAPVQIPADASRMQIVLPEGISLVAASLQQTDGVAEGSYLLVLYWTAARDIHTDYAVALTLADGRGQYPPAVIAARRLFSGAHPTSLWVPGEIYSETLELQLDFDPQEAGWILGAMAMPEDELSQPK